MKIKQLRWNLLMRWPVVVLITGIFFLVGMSPALRLAGTIITAASNFVATELIDKLATSPAEKLFLSIQHHSLQHEYRKAIKQCNLLIERYPVALPLAQRRQVYAILWFSYGAVEENDKKLQTYERMLREDPANAHFLRGLLYDDEGDYERARQELTLATQTTPQYPPLDEESLQIIHNVLEKYPE